MIAVPIKCIKRVSRRDGRRKRLKIVQKRSLTNGYSPFTGEIRLRPYNCPKKCAMRLSHEIKHQIDLQYWPAALVVLLYWPVLIVAAAFCGQLFGWFWTLPGFVAAYFLHPFEISANWYALRNWKKYHERIVRHNEKLENAQKT